MATPPSQNSQIAELKALIEKATNKIEKLSEELPHTYITRVDFEASTDRMEEATTRISEKLDKLTDDLPNRFLDRLQYTTGHTELTNRVATGESRVEELRKEVAMEKQRVNELHAMDIQWANKTFTEIRDLINARSDTQDKKLNQIQLEQYQRKDQIRSQLKTVLIGVGCGALLSFIATIILHLMHVV